MISIQDIVTCFFILAMQDCWSVNESSPVHDLSIFCVPEMVSDTNQKLIAVYYFYLFNYPVLQPFCNSVTKPVDDIVLIKAKMNKMLLDQKRSKSRSSAWLIHNTFASKRGLFSLEITRFLMELLITARK